MGVRAVYGIDSRGGTVMNIALGTCQVRGCDEAAVAIVSDGGLWCAECFDAFNEDDGCPCCASVGVWGRAWPVKDAS